ncbi:hypothetical protein HHK36_031562 [Tetracentron sinense]|uniref:Annexin n=1 Tax=Tetracentron sinense TaxID=13715 RepID=A0A834YBX5_TETSI|nr:hypothetical protein HHK36_031562 [Tetracentron sinense]
MSTLSVPPVPISPRDDAIQLYRAFKGLGCDTAAVVNILAHRDAAQRAILQQEYRTMYSDDLLKRLSSELSGNVKKAVLLWMYDPAGRDATILRQALSGDIIDLQAATEVVCSRTPSQIQQLKQVYHAKFGVYLEHDIEYQASGDHKKVVTTGIRAMVTYKELEERLIAVDGSIKHLATLIVALTVKVDTMMSSSEPKGDDHQGEASHANLRSNSNHGVHPKPVGVDLPRFYGEDPTGWILLAEQFKNYHHLDDEQMIEIAVIHLQKDAVLWNQWLLLACVTKPRYEGLEVDRMMVEKDAKALYKAGEKKLGTDEKTFINIFSERSRAHLSAVTSVYHSMYGNSLKKAIKSETSGNFEFALLKILRCAENPGKYFAKELHKAMKGLGTNDTTLIRIIVTRVEIDMQYIKAEYQKKHRKSLVDAVHSETSSHYRTFLLSLLGPKH